MHNKIFATGFAFLALALYLTWIIVAEISSGWTYFRNQPAEIWNAVLYLVVYSIILIGNIRNDNGVYRGIFFFLSFMVIDQIFSLLYRYVDLLANISSASVSAMLYFALFTAFMGGEIFSGIMAYIHIFRYASGRSSSFFRAFLWTLIFVINLFVAALFLFLFTFGGLYLLMLVPFSEALMGVSILFTLLRLRRI